jgi:hypothetical protein
MSFDFFPEVQIGGEDVAIENECAIDPSGKGRTGRLAAGPTIADLRSQGASRCDDITPERASLCVRREF